MAPPPGKDVSSLFDTEFVIFFIRSNNYILRLIISDKIYTILEEWVSKINNFEGFLKWDLMTMIIGLRKTRNRSACPALPSEALGQLSHASEAELCAGWRNDGNWIAFRWGPIRKFKYCEASGLIPWPEFACRAQSSSTICLAFCASFSAENSSAVHAGK